MFQQLVLVASYFEKRCKKRLNTSSNNKLCWHDKMKLFFARNVFFLRIYNCCWKCCCQHTFPLREILWICVYRVLEQANCCKSQVFKISFWN